MGDGLYTLIQQSDAMLNENEDEFSVEPKLIISHDSGERKDDLDRENLWVGLNPL